MKIAALVREIPGPQVTLEKKHAGWSRATAHLKYEKHLSTGQTYNIAKTILFIYFPLEIYVIPKTKFFFSLVVLVVDKFI